MAFTWEEQKVNYPDAADIIDTGLEKLDVYRNRAEMVPTYVLAMIIMPTMKLEWYTINMPGKVEWVKDIFINALRPYYNQPTDEPTIESTNDSHMVPEGNAQQWSAGAGILGLGRAHPRTTQRSLEAEVQNYLNEVSEISSSLSYWQVNQHHYPTIFALAMDILPIQGSAVPCERVFSSSKETMSACENCISLELMEAFQMLKFTARKGRGFGNYSLNFTAGMDWVDELGELELTATACACAEEDLPLYRDTLGRQ